MPSKTSKESGFHGLAPSEWEARLLSALQSRDHDNAKETLLALRREMTEEEASVQSFEKEPLISRLTEHTRRLLSTALTDAESLELELEVERSIWSDYRKRYRNSFVPTVLHPFLKSCALFLEQSTEKPQFSKYVKYFGATDSKSKAQRLEAVTLFAPLADRNYDELSPVTPPNFFSEFDNVTGQFVVKRAYRTHLPKGAGTECILEHIRAIVSKPEKLRTLAFDNVKNSATYNVFVTQSDSAPTLNPRPAEDRAPLVRVAKKILKELGLEPAAPTATLDTFGFLDLSVPVYLPTR